MRIVKRNERTPTRAPARKVARAVSAKSAKSAESANPTGLTGFSIDVSEPVGRKAFAALTENRASFQGFAAGAALNVKKLDPETAARIYLNQALASDAVKRFSRPEIETGTSDFQSLGTEAIALTGTTMVKFRQTFNKIPVYGSLVTVELDRGNECLAISSSLGTPKGVKHVATVSPVDALKVAAKESRCAVRSLNQTPRLYYYFDQDKARWCLAYIIENVARRKRKPTEGMDCDASLKDYVVDAHSGKLLAALPRTATMAAVQEWVTDALKHKRKITVEAVSGGKRQLHDSILNVTTYGFDFKDPTAQAAQLPGTLYSRPPGTWPVEAVGAHANGSVVASFLRNIVKRNNIDNLGGEMISTVNCWDRAEGITPARQWRNAYWNGAQMVYGQIQFPDGTFYSIASMLEVVGHEMFHGVTDHTSRLEYRTQSGALNESYSDIFGIVIANLSRPLKKWVWDVGVGFDGPGTALRSLADPERHGQPKKMSEYRTATPPYTYERNDYGWVHDNSGIHNFAAYKIMTASANGKYLFTPAQLAAIFYIALTVHLSRTSQFADSRRAVVQATRSLFRKESPTALAQKVQAVEKGFQAAGIV
jgi:Zn-dependent metalloprotease